MKIDLKGRVAIVTGGATGIGKGIAIALSKANANVIITSRQKNEIKKRLISMRNKRQFFKVFCVSNICFIKICGSIFTIMI